MKILTDAGLASARHFEGGQTRYEAALDRHHHDHLICTACGNIFEFENERIEHLQERVAAGHGFIVTHHKLELYGLCKSCQERQDQPRPR
jgi:Fur family ferric uptake transcriptional regulator